MYNNEISKPITSNGFTKSFAVGQSNGLINNSFFNTVKAMQEEDLRFFETKTAFKHEDILEQILEHLQRIDFYEEAGLGAGEKISLKHQVVITIQQILKASREVNLGLCRNQSFLYSFNGEFWNLIEKEDLDSFLRKCAEKLGVEKVTANYHKFVGELFKQFMMVANKSKAADIQETVLINLKNGTFEVTKK